jgi:site-specific DNA-methyltransferase (adenine-specific)
VKSLIKSKKNAFASFGASDIALLSGGLLSTGLLGDSTVDLIITAPPMPEDFSRFTAIRAMSGGDYRKFTNQWLERCFRLLKPDGRVCLCIPLDIDSNEIPDIGFTLTALAQEAHYRYHSTIIWREEPSRPIDRPSGYYDFAAPKIRAPVGLVVLLYKESWKKYDRSRPTNIRREDFMAWTNGYWILSRQGRWSSLPLQLAQRCVILFSFENDVIFDPFAKEGNVLLAARLSGRRAVGLFARWRDKMATRRRLSKISGFTQDIGEQSNGEKEASP